MWGWGSARVLGLLAVAVLAAAGWIAAELRAVTPLIAAMTAALLLAAAAGLLIPVGRRASRAVAAAE